MYQNNYTTVQPGKIYSSYMVGSILKDPVNVIYLTNRLNKII